MSIQGLHSTQSGAERRAASAAPARTAGASFQTQLENTAAAASTPAQASVQGGNLTAALDEARLLLLQRTKEGQDWKKEQDEWDRLLKGLDSWIEALRQRGERERKTGRSESVTADGGEALMALCRGYIAAAVRAEAAGEDAAPARDDLISALTAARDDLLARLKEDKAAEEEREEWAELLRRLDKWIAALRGEEEPEHTSRTEGVSAAGSLESEYKL